MVSEQDDSGRTLSCAIEALELEHLQKVPRNSISDLQEILVLGSVGPSCCSNDLGSDL